MNPKSPPQSATKSAAKKPKAVPADIAKMSFEAAIGELEEIVQDLEEGSGDLDRAIKAYERGTLLKQHCEVTLKEARMRVEKITLGADGGAKGLDPVDD